jgi:hypothetical protein
VERLARPRAALCEIDRVIASRGAEMMMMMKIRSTFQEAFERWAGDTDEVGATPAPAREPADFDDLPTEEIVLPRRLRRSPRPSTTAA